MKIQKITLFAILMIAFLSAIGHAALDPSIVLYYNFDKDEGGKIADLSGTGNDGTVTGIKLVKGKYANAFEFDGANSQIMVAANATLDLADGMTIMAWIFKTEFVPANNGETIVSKKQSGAYTLEVAGWENRFPEKLSSEPRISGTYHPVSSPDPLPLNQWVHAAVTYDGNFLRLYVDGQMVTEGQWPGKIDANTANFFVGAESDGVNPDATHGRFKGIIDEVIVANRGFSAEEIGSYMSGISAVDLREKFPIRWGLIKDAF